MTTLGELCDFVGGVCTLPRETPIRGVAPLAEAGEGQISFLANPKYAPQLETTKATAVLVAKSLEGDSTRFIRVDDPYFAMASIVAKFFDRRPMPRGISPLASIAKSARIGSNVGIGPFAVIADDVTIGDGTVIFQHVSIEAGSSLGANCIVYPNVSIYERTSIGDRVIIHSGAVIGADGYGFATHGGKHHKIPQVGVVRIENDVEVGANTCIDRAALGETVIGEGTKIDNLVQIAHNVRVGKHVLLVSQVGIAGSTELGDYVVAAGQSGFAGHLKIGKGAQVAAAASVLGDVDAGAKVMGTPAVPFREFARREAMLRRMLKRGKHAGD